MTQNPSNVANSIVITHNSIITYQKSQQAVPRFKKINLNTINPTSSDCSVNRNWLMKPKPPKDLLIVVTTIMTKLEIVSINHAAIDYNH